MNRDSVNKEALRQMKFYCYHHEVFCCEMRLPGCTGDYNLTFAHKHKRRWYYDKPDETLWKRSEWRLSCMHCHELQEYDKNITNQIFGE